MSVLSSTKLTTPEIDVGKITGTGKATFNNQSVDVHSLNFREGTQADFAITGTSGWVDIPSPVYSNQSSPNDPSVITLTGLSNFQGFTFPGSGGGQSMRQLFTSIHIPHNYCVGTGVFLHVHCLTDATVLTGDFVINFDYSYASGDGIFSASQTVSITSNFTNALQHRILEIPTPILASQLEVDGIIMVRLWRDHNNPSDTFAGDFIVLFIDCHMMTNKYSTKYKDKLTTGSFYQ